MCLSDMCKNHFTYNIYFTIRFFVVYELEIIQNNENSYGLWVI